MGNQKKLLEIIISVLFEIFELLLKLQINPEILVEYSGDLNSNVLFFFFQYLKSLHYDFEDVLTTVTPC
jgi:hypothetical protein